MQHLREMALETFVDLLLDAVFVVDRNGTIRFVSAASRRIFGYEPEEMIGRDVIEFVHPDDRPATLETIDEILEGRLKPVFENRYVHKDGSTVHIMWSARWSDENQVRVAVARDITQRKRAEAMQAAVYAVAQAAHAPGDLSATLRQIHPVIASLLPAANVCVVLADGNGELRTTYVSDQRAASPSTRAHRPHPFLVRVVETGESLRVGPSDETSRSPRSADGQARGVQNWLGVPLRNAAGTIGALGVYSYDRSERYSEEDAELLEFVAVEVSAAIERKAMRSELEHMARHDSLTDLPNRTLLLDRLAGAVARAERETARLAVIYLDLDDFKIVNDTYGHSVGDRLLQHVATRLAGSVRGSDTVGRLGGDEFVVVLDRIAEVDDAFMVAEKIRSVLTVPYDLDGRTVEVAPSVGVAVYPEHGIDVDALIGHADAAMYRNKRRTDRAHGPPGSAVESHPTS